MVDELEALLAPRTDIPEHRKKWGWGGTLDERAMRRADVARDLANTGPAGRLCGPACGPTDPLLAMSEPRFALEGIAS